MADICYRIKEVIDDDIDEYIDDFGEEPKTIIINEALLISFVSEVNRITGTKHTGVTKYRNIDLRGTKKNITVEVF